MTELFADKQQGIKGDLNGKVWKCEDNEHKKCIT